MSNLSLLHYCSYCGAKCCKASNQIGLPIISEEEAKIINNNFGKGHLKKEILQIGSYYVPQEKNGHCIFLKYDDRCLIQEIKPLDDQIYPIKAIYDQGVIIYVIDGDCPAVKDLSQNFITQAKEVAMRSIKRFKPEIYIHWLNKYIRWIQKASQI